MHIQFPLSYPFASVLAEDVSKIAQTGLPFFNVCWLSKNISSIAQTHLTFNSEFQSEYSLLDRCIKVITESSELTLEDIKLLPLQFSHLISSRRIENQLSKAAQEIVPWTDTLDNPEKENNIFEFLNRYVFNNYLVAFPSLDITQRNMGQEPDDFSIDIREDDFKNTQSVLRLMRGQACVGLSFLLEMDNGTRMPWSLLQGYAQDPHIWCLCQTIQLCPSHTLVRLQSLQGKEEEFARKVEKIDVSNRSFSQDDIQPLLNFWKTFQTDQFLVKILKQLLLRESIYVIEKIEMEKILETQVFPKVLKATLATTKRTR